MFREKLGRFFEKRGYLYIRESVYVRDKRTLKRKPPKLCNGKATKERGKYSKKKDIYCGKIHEVELKRIITFREYIENTLKKDYLEFKINAKFDSLVDSFVRYLLYLYEIDEEEFYLGQKKVFVIGEGYLSKETIGWLKRFNVKTRFDNPKEIERFTYRCEDVGIHDGDIINTLYIKLVPLVEKQDLIAGIEKQKGPKDFASFKDFIKKSS